MLSDQLFWMLLKVLLYPWYLSQSMKWRPRRELSHNGVSLSITISLPLFMSSLSLLPTLLNASANSLLPISPLTNFPSSSLAVVSKSVKRVFFFYGTSRTNLKNHRMPYYSTLILLIAYLRYYSDITNFSGAFLCFQRQVSTTQAVLYLFFKNAWPIQILFVT